MRLSSAQQRALEWLADQKYGSTLFSMETSAGVFMATLDSLAKRGLIDFGTTEAIVLSATCQQFRDAQKHALLAVITDAGRSALPRPDRVSGVNTQLTPSQKQV